MTREQLWKRYVERNPHFETGPTITFRPETLKRFFNQIYDQAHNQGVANGRALAATDDQLGNLRALRDSLADLFPRIRPRTEGGA